MNEHTDIQMDRQAEENTKKQLVTGRQMDWQMNKQTDRQMSKQTERWKNVKIDGQADRQVGKQTVCLSDGWTY